MTLHLAVKLCFHLNSLTFLKKVSSVYSDFPHLSLSYLWCGTVRFSCKQFLFDISPICLGSSHIVWSSFCDYYGISLRLFLLSLSTIHVIKDVEPLPDYSDIKKDSKRHEHFTSLLAVLESFLVGLDLPNEAELQGIFGRVSQEVKMVKGLFKRRERWVLVMINRGHLKGGNLVRGLEIEN